VVSTRCSSPSSPPPEQQARLPQALWLVLRSPRSHRTRDRLVRSVGTWCQGRHAAARGRIPAVRRRHYRHPDIATRTRNARSSVLSLGPLPGWHHFPAHLRTRNVPGIARYACADPSRPTSALLGRRALDATEPRYAQPRSCRARPPPSARRKRGTRTACGQRAADRRPRRSAGSWPEHWSARPTARCGRSNHNTDQPLPLAKACGAAIKLIASRPPVRRIGGDSRSDGCAMCDLPSDVSS